MGSKRLNTKVAWSVSLVVALLALVGVMTLAYVHRDAEVYLADAREAAARGATEKAIRYYKRAYERLTDRNAKIDVLFQLAPLYDRLDQWPKVMGCWNAVVLEDPNQVRARLALIGALSLEARAHSRVGVRLNTAWKELEAQATSLWEVAERQNLLDRPVVGLLDPLLLESFRARQDPNEALGELLLAVRAQARLEQAQAGSEADPLALLDAAEQDARALLQRHPGRVRAFQLLADIDQQRAERFAAKADAVAAEQALQRAEETLRQATEQADDPALAQVLWLNFRLERAQRAGNGQELQALQRLELPIKRLAERFPERPEVQGTVAQYHLVHAYFVPMDQRAAFFDRAIAAARRASELSGGDIDRRLALAVMLYRRATLFEETSLFDEAIDVAQRCLTAGSVDDERGPLGVEAKLNRLAVHRFLATCAIEQLLDAERRDTDPDRPRLLELAQSSVHEIEQLRGSGEDLEVAKWRGMLDWVAGRRAAGVRNLLRVYEKMRASTQGRQVDAQVAYALARAFENSPEQGKALEFFAMALHGGLRFTRPQVMLDYLEVLGRLDRWDFVISGANPYGVDVYERLFGATPRSRALRMQALIATNRMADAEQLLYGLDPQDPTTVKLRLLWLKGRIQEQRNLSAQIGDTAAGGGRVSALEQQARRNQMQAELQSLQDQQVEWVTRWLEHDPNEVPAADLAAACQRLLERGEAVEVGRLCRLRLAVRPDDLTALMYERWSREPNPGELTPQQRSDLQRQAIEALSDPVRRAVELGRLYRRTGRSDEALEQMRRALREALRAGVSAESRWTRALTEDPVVVAADTAFELALQRNDADVVEAVLEDIRRLNVDGCGGMLYEARLRLARDQADAALEAVQKCLEHRPLFSHGLLLRGMIELAQGQIEPAVRDALQAAQWNPTSPGIAKFKARALLARLQDQPNSGPQIRSEAMLALENALRLNPQDTELLRVYVEQIQDSDPEKALAIYQVLNREHPTVDNAVTLGTLATRLAVRAQEPARRAVFLRVARESLERAYTERPADPNVLQAYAAYYQAIGETEKATAMLEQSGRSQVRWVELLMRGQIQEARQVLQEAYDADPRDPNTLRGLAALAEMTGDLPAMIRTLDELVSVEDTAFNRVSQVTVLLKRGATTAAADRLDELMQRFPDEPQVPLLQGWLALRQGHLDQARSMLDAVIQERPDDPTAYDLRGTVLRLLGQPDEALLDLRQSKRLEDRPYRRLALAQAYEEAERWQAALQEYQDLLSQPGCPVLAWTRLERLLIERGRDDDRRRLYERAQQAFPASAAWLNRWGQWDLQSGRVAQAVTRFQQAFERCRARWPEAPVSQWPLDAEWVQACDGWMRALLEAGRFDDLERVVAQVGDSSLGPLAALRRAQALARQGRNDEARDVVLEVLAGPRMNLDRLLPWLAELEEVGGEPFVRAVADRLLEQDPASLAGHLLLWSVHREAGRFDDALEALDRVIARTMASGDVDAQVTLVGLKTDLLMERFEQTGQSRWVERAVSDYQSLYEKMPKNSSVLNNLAYVMAQGRVDLSRALDYAQRALADDPDSPVVLDTVAFIQARRGRTEEALRLLWVALQQFELRGMMVPAEVYEHLGEVLEDMGRAPLARRAYQRALAAGARSLSERARERIQAAIGRLP